MKVVECRFVVSDEVDPARFLEVLVRSYGTVIGGVLLDNNGFGHLMPTGTTEFTHTLTKEVEQAVLLALHRGQT